MRTNPFADTLAFLMQNWWPIYAFWLLLGSSIALALVNLARDPQQRSARHAWMWIMRLLIGGMWWQQTLWKLPPTYTDSPDGVSGGVPFWGGENGQASAFCIQNLLGE